jgi:hypothetical protein
MAHKIESLSGFDDLIGFTILAANGAWPKFLPFTEDHNENLKLMFDRFEQGLPVVDKKLRDEEKFERVKQLLAEARSAYLEGERRKGAHLLQAISQIICPNALADYEKRKGLRDNSDE